MKNRSLIALVVLSSLSLASSSLKAEDCCPVNPYGSQTPIYVPSDEPNDAPVVPGGSEVPVYVPSENGNPTTACREDESDGEDRGEIIIRKPNF